MIKGLLFVIVSIVNAIIITGIAYSITFSEIGRKASNEFPILFFFQLLICGILFVFSQYLPIKFGQFIYKDPNF